MPRNGCSQRRSFLNTVRTQANRVYWLTSALCLVVALSSSFVFIRSAAARQLASTVPVVTVPAASFEQVPVAPDEIVAAFGVQLATQAVGATSLPLPTVLGGTTVTVNGRPAGLLFVSPNQVNYVVPTNTEIGPANIVVRAGDGTVSNGVVQVVNAAPAVFTASGNGQGAPVALVRRIRNGQELPSQTAAQLDTQNRWVPRPIDLGPEGDIVLLELYLSGIRHAPDPNGDGNANESVHVVLGGVDIVPIYAGRQPDFVGLDQIDAQIPRSLLGRGRINLSITAPGGNPSNITEVEISGAASNAPPQVSNFSPAAALAGQTLVINGNGFSPTPSDNLVRIGGVEARITSATATQLSVVVPFGARGGAVSVRTTQGEGSGASQIALRTSISGFIENTARQPLSGITVRLVGTSITARTGAEGAFILPDVPSGASIIEVDGTTVPTTPPFPKIILKAAVEANRDNQFARPISLQQATGADLNVGTSSSIANRAARVNTTSTVTNAASAVQSNNITFDVPAGASSSFPDGSTGGTLTLTRVDNSRTPVNLPAGFFSSAIAQVTPFKTILTPGGKLTFPNTDGLQAGTQVKLFRFDQTTSSATLGSFIEAGVATVSADGQRIETAPGAITEMGYYFVSGAGQTTTVIGRVVDSDGTTPVRQALVRARGQEAFTDGNGAFIVRNVQVNPGDQISVEASFLRPNGRVDRTQQSGIAAVINGVTNVTPALVLPSEVSNRSPVITAPSSLAVNEGATQDVNFVAADPDSGQTIQLGVSGASFASIIPRGNDLYTLHLATHVNDAGRYTLSLVATDNQGAGTVQNISLRVNRPPVANVQSAITDQDVSKTITLTGSDPDGDPISFIIVSNPSHGSLSGTLPNLTYKPVANYTGTDNFAFKVNDGLADSNTATVSIFINPVNHAPTLTVPGPQALNDGQTLNLTITASDIDVGQTLTFTATNLPGGATFTQLTTASARLTWTPNSSQTGTQIVNFKVSDNGSPMLSDTKTVTIAVVGQWSPTTGIEGGSIFAMASNGGILFAGTHGGGIFRSTDNGQSWATANTGLTNLFVNTLVSNGTSLFAGTGVGSFLTPSVGAVFRSTDNGQSWTPVLTNAFTYAMAVSGTSVFVSINGGGFVRSTDNGQSWTPVNTGLPQFTLARSFAVSGSNIFAGTQTDGMFLSTNNGQSWTAVNNGLPANTTIRALSISGANIFAGTDGGLFVSTNNGQSWTAVTNLPGTRGFGSTVVGGSLLVSTEQCLCRSTDNGQSWTAATGFPQNALSFTVNGSSIFAGSFDGVYRSTDNGQSWSLSSTSITATGSIVLSAGAAGLFATVSGCSDCGGGGVLYRSGDNGQSWTNINAGIPSVFSLAASGTNFFIGTYDGVYLTTDSGQSWRGSVGLPRQDPIYALAFSGTDLFAGTGHTGVYRSTDNGQTWAPANAGISNLYIRAIAVSGTTLFAGADANGIYRSTDNGQTWTAVNSGLANQSVFTLAVSGTNILSGTLGNGVYRSTNNGNSWVNVSTGLPANTTVHAFALSGSSIFAATNNGVFISLNQGQSWTAVETGLPNSGIISLTVNGASLYAGASGNGVYRSTY